jgi:hypothetical protein
MYDDPKAFGSKDASPPLRTASCNVAVMESGSCNDAWLPDAPGDGSEGEEQ